MSHTVTLELTADDYTQLEREATAVGLTPAEFALRATRDRLPRPVNESNRGILRQLFGSVNLGDPTGADNVRIDADLADEYGRGLSGHAD